MDLKQLSQIASDFGIDINIDELETMFDYIVNGLPMQLDYLNKRIQLQNLYIAILQRQNPGGKTREEINAIGLLRQQLYDLKNRLEKLNE